MIRRAWQLKMKDIINSIPLPKKIDIVLITIGVAGAIFGGVFAGGRFAESQEQMVAEVRALRQDVNILRSDSSSTAEALHSVARSLDQTQEAMTRLLDRMNKNDAEDLAQGAKIKMNKEEIDRLRDGG